MSTVDDRQTIKSYIRAAGVCCAGRCATKGRDAHPPDPRIQTIWAYWSTKGKIWTHFISHHQGYWLRESEYVYMPTLLWSASASTLGEITEAGKRFMEKNEYPSSGVSEALKQSEQQTFHGGMPPW